jgi:hypothetical protein
MKKEKKENIYRHYSVGPIRGARVNNQDREA